MLTLSGTHGELGGNTILKCIFEAGTVTDNAVKWSSVSSEKLEEGEKYGISSRNGDTFTLTIKTTEPGDLQPYVCEYDNQNASYELTEADIEGDISYNTHVQSNESEREKER